MNNSKKIIGLSSVLLLIFVCLCGTTFATKKNSFGEKKKSIGSSVKGKSKVWNSNDGVVSTNDDTIKPVEEKKYKTGVFGADEISNYIKGGILIKTDDKYNYVLDDGSLAANTWINIDMDDDMLYEYCYFGPNGEMVVNTKTVDGYKVNESGVWVNDKGEVQKLQGFIADSNIVKKNFTGAQVKEDYNAGRKENLDSGLIEYFDSIGNTGDFVSKNAFRSYLVNKKKCTSAEADVAINGIDWSRFALENLMKMIEKKDINDIITKNKVDNRLRSLGFSSTEIEAAFANCGIADFNTLTDAIVKDILNNSVGKLKVKLIENIKKRGLTESEVLDSISRIKGRTITMSDIINDEE